MMDDKVSWVYKYLHKLDVMRVSQEGYVTDV